MATWGLHIRLAEELLNKNTLKLDRESFLVGNVAADAGKPNEDWSVFTPPPEISHWKDKDKRIRPDLFLESNLTCKVEDHKKWSFLVGYYVHLLTDVEWVKMFENICSCNKDYAKVTTDKNFIWEIKKRTGMILTIYISEIILRVCSGLNFNIFIHFQTT